MSGIEAYDLGREDGAAEERKRILDWILDNRSEFGSKDEDLYVYRDHFSSEDLIAFIKGELDE
jgi:hypothetical protein